jgi:hypothetical protein
MPLIFIGVRFPPFFPIVRMFGSPISVVFQDSFSMFCVGNFLAVIKTIFATIPIEAWVFIFTIQDSSTTMAPLRRLLHLSDYHKPIINEVT